MVLIHELNHAMVERLREMTDRERIKHDLTVYAENNDIDISTAIDELVSFASQVQVDEWFTLSKAEQAWRVLQTLEDQYPFKREVFYQIQDEFQKHNVIFLLGPRKCGKTVCLQQLSKLPSTQYVSFRDISSDTVFDDILSSIKYNLRKVYLIDEITYAEDPERLIRTVAGYYEQYANTETNIVFTGSQSQALRQWGSLAFSSLASYIYIDFLKYNEWLTYKSYQEPTEDNYREFLLTVSDFYKFKSIKDYLQSCIDETIQSNAKSLSVLYGSECNLVDVNKLLDVCYVTLFTLHSNVSIGSFMKSNYLASDIKYFFKDTSEDYIDAKIKASFIFRYSKIQKQSASEFAQALMLLRNWGLITVTNVTADVNDVIDISTEFNKLALGNSTILNFKEDLFRRFNFCIRYPMFYVSILQEILGPNVSIDQPLLGSIIECHIRGLLPDHFAVILHTNDDAEIDYVNTIDNYALEIKSTDIGINYEIFKTLPKQYRRLGLSRTKEGSSKNLTLIPYYKFAANSQYYLKGDM